MTKLEYENIVSQMTNLKNLPNNVIENFLEQLNVEFETTKNNIISLTYHLDKMEELYNITLKEYQNRNDSEKL